MLSPIFKLHHQQHAAIPLVKNAVARNQWPFSWMIDQYSNIANIDNGSYALYHRWLPKGKVLGTNNSILWYSLTMKNHEPLCPWVYPEAIDDVAIAIVSCLGYPMGATRWLPSSIMRLRQVAAVDGGWNGLDQHVTSRWLRCCMAWLVAAGNHPGDRSAGESHCWWWEADGIDCGW